MGTIANLLTKVVYRSMFKGNVIGSLLVIRAFPNKTVITFLFVLQSIAVDVVYISGSTSVCMCTRMPYVHIELL